MTWRKQRSARIRGILVRIDVALQNQLINLPSFRRDVDRVKPPRGKVGMPIQHFLRLPLPQPVPSAPDLAMTFAVGGVGGEATRKWDVVFAVEARDEGAPRLFAADAKGVQLVDAPGEVAPFPGGAAGEPPSAHGIVAVDWNSDYATDLVMAGAGGLKLFRQADDGSFADATDATRLGAEVLNLDLFGVWAADFELDGDLDFLVAPRSGSPFVLVNDGRGRFAVARPFAEITELRGAAWADFDGDGTPDFALLDQRGILHIFTNERGGKYRRSTAPKVAGQVVSIVAADLDADGTMDLIALQDDGAILRASIGDDGEGMGGRQGGTLAACAAARGGCWSPTWTITAAWT